MSHMAFVFAGDGLLSCKIILKIQLVGNKEVTLLPNNKRF